MPAPTSNTPSGADGLTPLDDRRGPNLAGRGRHVPSRAAPVPPISLEELLERGADVNAQSKTGVTALMIAATHNNPPMIGMLIDAGADPTLKNNSGKTAADVAELNGNAEAAAGHHGAGLRRSRRATPSARVREYQPMISAELGVQSLVRGRGVSRGPCCPLLCVGAVGAAEPARRRGGREQGGRRHHRRALQRRRLRLPRSQARRRPQSRLRAGQDRARHGRLWLVRQYHLPRQGQRRRSNTPSTSGSSPTATSSR